jgi:hypothetical protein
VNDADLTVGSYTDELFNSHAVAWKGLTPIPLPEPPGSISGSASGFGPGGSVIGVVWTDDGPTVFRWTIRKRPL